MRNGMLCSVPSTLRPERHQSVRNEAPTARRPCSSVLPTMCSRMQDVPHWHDPTAGSLLPEDDSPVPWWESELQQAGIARAKVSLPVWKASACSQGAGGRAALQVHRGVYEHALGAVAATQVPEAVVHHSADRRTTYTRLAGYYYVPNVLHSISASRSHSIGALRRGLRSEFTKVGAKEPFASN
jgi:hypothetical protein